jgi:hypothetical protein
LATILVPLAAVALGAEAPPDFELKWGSYGTGSGQFIYTVAVAVDGDGYVYATDYSHRVQKFDGEGNYETHWGWSYEDQLDLDFPPWGLDIDAEGNLYVVDGYNDRVEKYDENGSYVTEWGSTGSGDGEFNAPIAVAAAADGHVYVVDQGNNRIQKFEADGSFVTEWGSYGTGNGQLYYPCDVTLDGDGYVYVADQFNHRVQKFTDDGTLVTKWGSYGTGDGQFDYAVAVAVDANADIFVADFGNSRVQKFNPPVLEVSIDVKPDSDVNPVNPSSKGVIPVAILTTSTAGGDSLDFDATNVDPGTVEFGPDGAAMDCKKAHLKDVDDDGDTDLLLHFRCEDTGIADGDTEVSLTGTTYGGREIEGNDSIKTVGGK